MMSSEPMPHVTQGIPRRRVLVAMSGGVDSSIAAAIMVEAGHEVVGATMKTFCYEDTTGPSRTCCGLDGILDARRVADHLGIPHYVFDVEEEFTRDVIDDFVSEYAEGRTPNPCVRCNSNTKFRDLLRRGQALGCDRIATGHYVRLVREADHGVPSMDVNFDAFPGEHPVPKGSPREAPRLLRGLDRNKDQSYFLWGLPPELLHRLDFPVGHLTKEEVRERARVLQLATAEKPESQEICFVPGGDYRELLSRRLPTRHPALEPGDLVLSDGTVLGQHGGYAGFTVGQRKGLGGGFSEPLYVIEVRPPTKEVVIGPYEELFSGGVAIREVNWLVSSRPNVDEEVSVQLRYRAEAVPARILPGDPESGRRERHASGKLTLEFSEPQRSVTPGQSAVIFRGEQVLGGGRIERALAPNRLST
jgi:tRNA-uridine 2-sulfurtransferase